MEQFAAICKSYGIFTTVRREMGQDIAGACGQLVVATSKASACSSSSTPAPTPPAVYSDIEDVGQHQRGPRRDTPRSQEPVTPSPSTLLVDSASLTKPPSSIHRQRQWPWLSVAFFGVLVFIIRVLVLLGH